MFLKTKIYYYLCSYSQGCKKQKLREICRLTSCLGSFLQTGFGLVSIFCGDKCGSTSTPISTDDGHLFETGLEKGTQTRDEFDLAYGNGDLVDIGQLEMGDSGLLLLNPRDVYFVVTYTINPQGKKVDYVPLLEQTSPHFKMIKDRFSKSKSKPRMSKSISLPEGEKLMKKRRSLSMDSLKAPPHLTHSLPDLNGLGGGYYSIPTEMPTSVDTVSDNKERLVGTFEPDFQKNLLKKKGVSRKSKGNFNILPKPSLATVTSDELARDSNGRLVITEDGYHVDKNGYLRDAEGKLVKRGDYFVDKDGLLRTEDGDLLVINGFNVNKDGKKVTKDGFIVSDDGLLLHKNGERLVVKGYFVNQDGMLVKENGEFVKSKDGIHYLDRHGLLRDANGGFIKTHQDFYINDDGLLADANGVPIKTKDNHFIDKNLYLVDANNVPVKDAFGRPRKANPSQLIELLFDKDSVTGKYITTPTGHFVDKQGFARDKDGNYIIGEGGFRVNKDGILVHDDGTPVRKNGFFISEKGLYVDQDGKPATSFDCNIGADGFLRTKDGELITVDDYVINAKGLLCTKAGNVVTQDGYAVNKNRLLVDKNGKLKQANGFFVNRDGVLCDQEGQPVLQNNNFVREDGLICDKNGAPIKKNGHYVNKDGVVCDSNGKPISVGDLYMNHNNVLCDKNGILATAFGHNINKDGLLCDKDGNLLMVGNNYVNSQGVVCDKYGEPIQQENGKYINKDGLLCDKNGNLEMIDNKYYVGKDGKLRDIKGNIIKKDGHSLDRSMFPHSSTDEFGTKGGPFGDKLAASNEKDATSREIRDKFGRLIKKDGQYIGKDGQPIDPNSLTRDGLGKLSDTDGKSKKKEKFSYEKPAAQQTLIFNEKRPLNKAEIFKPGTTLQLKEKDHSFTMVNMDKRKCRYVEEELAKRKRALRLGICHDDDIVHGTGPPNKKWWSPTGQLLTTKRTTDVVNPLITKMAKTFNKTTQTDPCLAVKTLAQMKNETENYHKQFDNLMPKL